MKRLLFLVALSIPLMAGADSTPTQSFDAATPANKTRACGLVFLKEGRALARTAKAMPAGKESQGALQSAMDKLTLAFTMLGDGRRSGADTSQARELSYLLMPASAGVSESVHQLCVDWTNARKAQPDFVMNEAEQWSVVAQATRTFDTE